MNLKIARIKAGMTQAEVAQAVGVNQASVSLWESGVTLPRAATLVALADLYCCTTDELLGREAEKR